MKSLEEEPRRSYREKIRTFLSATLPPSWEGLGALAPEEARSFSQTWRDTLRDHGLLAPSWPKEYGGGGLTQLEMLVLAEEFEAAGVPTGITNDIFSIDMVGNTLLDHGTDEQRAYFLPRIISGEHRWCQGYSEPNAGSDLASLKTRAELDGDEFVINGQKVWASNAHHANWVFVLCRTDPDAPKHKGITFLLCPMEQPGIEVRPIRMLTGDSEFNEIFFTDARTSSLNVVGGVNNGWTVAMTLLGYERGETFTTFPRRFRGELDKLIALADQYDRLQDPLVRQQLAWCFSRVEILRYLSLRELELYLSGNSPGPETALFKLFWSEYHKELTNIAIGVLGAHALTPSGKRPNYPFIADQPGSPNDTASWVGVFLHSRAGTIYAGSSEVQRTILGERMLGLPHEPKF